MELQKLQIENMDNKKSFSVLFNPTDYTVEDGSTWQDQKRNGQRPELQYTGGQRKTLTMELFLDTYESKEDVRIHTGKIARLLVPTVNQDNQGKRPPKVKLTWGLADPDPANGIFPFECVLEKLTQKFTLFTGDGKPVRATLNVTFKEFRLPKDELKRNPRRKSFPDQTYTVKVGDTLSGIAGEYLQDSRLWRRIADANDILNPRKLASNQILQIPRTRD